MYNFRPMKLRLMHILKSCLIVLTLATTFLTCQKPFTIDSNDVSAGSLKNDVNGDCLGSYINGTFTAGKLLGDTNSIEVQVDVTTVGSYAVSTNIVNGYYFSGEGQFSATGINMVKLTAKGTPGAAGSDHFTVSYNNTACEIVIEVLHPASTSAQFTLGGSGSNCTGATVQGSYTAGVALTNSNTAAISVHVTTPGSYTITTNTVDGVTFSSTGAFTSTGDQQVTLTGHGTPVMGGNVSLTVDAGGGTCNFAFEVLPSAAGTATFSLVGSGGNCSNSALQGDYVVNTALGAENLLILTVNVTVTGTWSVTTEPVNGITFTGTGTFSSSGTQTITLHGEGTPTAPGTVNIPVIAGSSNCDFTVSITDNSTAPCDPVDNTADLSGVNSITFTFNSSVSTGGSYTITASGSGGDLVIEFAGTAQPAAGVYNIRAQNGDFNAGDVRVAFTASDIYWQSYEGLLYVTVNNGKVTVVFCDIGFTGTLGGPSFSTTANAKVTEL